MRTLILGAGAMGTAFTFPLADAGCRVQLVGTHLDDEWVAAMKRSRRHPKLPEEIPGSVEPRSYSELTGALESRPELIVLGVSSPGVEWAVAQLRSIAGYLTAPQRPAAILMLTKGLALQQKRITVLPRYVASQLATDRRAQAQPQPFPVSVGGVGGPCIAAELAARRQSSVVIAGPDRHFRMTVQPALQAPYYHARYSTDLIGVEACAALKNFYAIGVGAAAGSPPQNGPGTHNLAAGIFTQALIEMRRIVAYLGGRKVSVDELAGTGDLYVTAGAGRNSRLGGLLGDGLSYGEARAAHMADATIEGADLAVSVGAELLRLHKKLPLAAAIVHAVRDDRPLEIPWSEFY